MITFVKDPQAVLDYQFNWATWLDGDTISSYTVTVDGVTLDSDTNTSTTVTAWLSGGTLGARAYVTCQIVTASGRTDERTIKLIIDNK